MVDASGSFDVEAGPDPAEATTPAEFVAAMRRLKLWSGTGFRRLAKNADTAGEALPRSTLTAALSRDTLPREELVAAFVRACGGNEDVVRHWVAERRRIAGTTDSEPAATTDPPRSWLGDLLPPAIRRGSWPVRVLSVVLVGIVAVTVLAAVVGTARDMLGLSGQDPAQGLGPGPEASEPTDEPSPELDSPGSVSNTVSQGWTVVRQGNLTISDEQSIDFDTLTVGKQVAGRDLEMGQRGTRLGTAEGGGITLLESSGEHLAARCTGSPPEKWDGLLHKVHELAPGRDICLATSEHRTVMITVDRAPDSADPVLVFHFTVWERLGT